MTELSVPQTSPRITRKWTPEEELIMRDRYPYDGASILALLLARTQKSVMKKAHHMGLKVDGVTESEVQQLTALHARKAERDRIALQNPNRKKQRQEKSRASGVLLRKKRRDEGLCIRCGQPGIAHSKQFCLLHWAHMIGGGTCKVYSETYARRLLDKLEQQNYRCAMTGELLVPGLNASLDHVIPKCKGGSVSDLSNLQWVTDSVNFAKRQFLSDEFIQFCRKVVSFHDEQQQKVA